MITNLKKTINNSILPILASVLLVVGIIYAWTEPTSVPPAGNVDAPVNVGSGIQYKSGAFGVGGLLRGYSMSIFDGNVGIGTVDPTSPAPNGQVANIDVNDIYLRSIGQWVSTAMAAGGGGCYVSYKAGCSGNDCCVDGFTNKGSAGKWGFCCNVPGGINCNSETSGPLFRPPSAGCYPGYYSSDIGEAYICCL